MSSIRVTLRCFSHVRDVLGKPTIDLELPAGATAGDAAREVRSMGGEKLRELPMRIALNESFVEESAPLSDGDELALIPPVQGG